MRLIDADALIETIENERTYLINRGLNGMEDAIVHHALPLIDNAPTIKAKPKTGEWVPCTKSGLILSELIRAENVAKWYGYKCSECNYIHKGNALVECNYCPKCGAKMDKEVEE